MVSIRAFIAISLPDPVRQRLDEIEKHIQHAAGDTARRAVRWVPAQNIHLTLKFLGEVDTASIPTLSKLLAAETARHASFPLIIENTGAFPNLRRPRIIWAGVRESTPLARLQKSVDVSTRALGYPSEDRPFSAHLTLGRVSPQAGNAEIMALVHALESTSVGEIAAFPVELVHLFRSDLRPGGPIYTAVDHFPLHVIASE